jgi:hypothetical protein
MTPDARKLFDEVVAERDALRAEVERLRTALAAYEDY